MDNPYRAPKHDSEVAAPSPLDELWSVRSVLRSMAATVKGRPLTVLLAVGALPALWSLPGDMVRWRVVPDDVPYDYRRSLLQILVPWATAAWACVASPGQQLVALKATADAPAGPGDFVTGLRHAPAFFALGALLALPLELVSLLPLSEDVSGALMGLMFIPIAVLVTRTWLVAPRLVDARCSLLEGLAFSWGATRGRAAKAFGLLLVSALLTLPLLATEMALGFRNYLITWALLGLLWTLAAAEVYARVTGRKPAGVAAREAVARAGAG
jgi:hypothetical protein